MLGFCKLCFGWLVLVGKELGLYNIRYSVLMTVVCVSEFVYYSE